MPVSCIGYTVRTSGNTWQTKKNWSTTAGLKTDTSQHAEKVVFDTLPQSTCYLLVQNAFPCTHCHNHFKGRSQNGSSIIIKVTANEGAYSADHGFGLNGGTPCIIYYHQGTATYGSITHAMAGTAGPHANFPPHPSIDDV